MVRVPGLGRSQAPAPWRRALLAAALGWLLRALDPAAVAAYETDQHSHRTVPIADCTAALNARVGEVLTRLAARWSLGVDRARFAQAVYWRLGGIHWVDRIERWAMRSPRVEKLPTPRLRSIYHGLPFPATRVTFFFGVGKTIKVDGVLIGSDKLGHFMSQGLKFYRRWRRHGSEARAAEHSRFTEAAIFGQPFTGVFSNADLVANYEGYRFYRSLFEDDVVAGKKAIIRFRGRGAVVQRPFDWADHVNPFWDEVKNPNHYDRWLAAPLRARLATFCPQVAADPELWLLHDPEPLAARYAHLGLRDTSANRMDRICGLDGVE